MKFKKFSWIVAVILAASLAAEDDSSLNKKNANNDHGFWLEQNMTKEFRSNWMITLRSGQRWEDDYRKFYYQEYEVDVEYDVTKFFCQCSSKFFKKLTMGPGYNATRQIQKNTEDEFHWVWINRSLLQANLTLSVYDWQIEQRLRGEYRQYTKSHYKDFGLCRYRLVARTPWKWTCLNIRPYLSNEWFFRENTYQEEDNPDGLVGGWYENRFRVGTTFDVYQDWVSTALYWQWRTIKQKPDVHPRWFNSYQIGLAINLAF